MQKTVTEFSTNATLTIGDESLLGKYVNPQQAGLYTFIWSQGKTLELIIDGLPTMVAPNSIVSLTPVQHLQVLEAEDVIVYQFNREFYCIKDHDKQVGCAGILFFGNNHIPIIELDEIEQIKFDQLHHVFLDEMETQDTIQAEMLRMLLARFIIKTTRLLKQSQPSENASEGTSETFRKYNILVEAHFKEAHNVSFYADKLYKSPKTLSNSFKKLNKSPLRIIHDRLILETKRQLRYTEKTTKEIAYEIGFEDPSHLSRLFKKVTGLSPTQFKGESTLV